MSATIELDKTITADVETDLGKIVIRAVVMAKKKDQEVATQQVVPADADPDEVYLDVRKGPLDSYLEDPRSGKGFAVFLINGQRHHVWDNTFIVRDLGLKYLRNRTMIIVDLDMLSPEALGEIIQGSRQGLYEGSVYHAIRDRVVATLKKDPDLEKLEDAAEQEISDLRTGDEAVKQTLDQLIDDHHTFADHTNTGMAQPGDSPTKQVEGWGKDINQDVVISGDNTVGDPATGPVLIAQSFPATVRLRSGERKSFRVSCEPAASWTALKGVKLDLIDGFEGLSGQVDRDDAGATVTLTYDEPDEFDREEYPVEAGLRLVARFDGFAESRLIERRVVASLPPGPPPPPPPPPQLIDPPTYIRVSSRQPVRLTIGAADTHVRFRWDGKDSLVVGAPPDWIISGRCLTIPAYPPVAFSRPSGGRFAMLVPAPTGLVVGQTMVFEVTATGPNGVSLMANFAAVVVDPPEPRRIKAKVPDSAAQRRPPYALKIIGEKEWETGCWGDESWTAHDAAVFKEPTQSSPLTLIINEDQAQWKEYRESMTKRKLVEATVKERTTRYTSHVAFHLYQMYQQVRRTRDQVKAGADVEEPKEDQMRGEINRVAATLIRLMEVSR